MLRKKGETHSSGQKDATDPTEYYGKIRKVTFGAMAVCNMTSL
jgi:hypothetical protein